MADRLLSYEVADLCLGKPPLRSLPISSTVADALAALKSSSDNFISIWNCDHSSPNATCQCVGKIGMVDIICFLSQKDNLESPSTSLKSPVTALLSTAPLVRHIESSSSLVDAMNLIAEGTQNLVVSIKMNSRRKTFTKSLIPSRINHNGREFCWLTQEDVIRFLLSSIGLFSPTQALSIEDLGIITTDFAAIRYHSSASDAIEAISQSLANQTSVAVINDEGVLIGEISPFTLACCDETVAAAITTLSAGDLMSYIDCGGPPEEMVKTVKTRLKERNLERMLEDFAISPTDVSFSNSSSSCSSDEESFLRYSRSSSYSSRMVRRAEAIVCYPWSSLVAVMIQAIAHRVNYVWVIEEDSSLVGIVTFLNILDVFRQHLESMA